MQKKERIFITGGMGYLGSYLGKEALKKGHDVCLYDSLLYEQNVSRMISEIVKNKKGGAKLESIIGDVRNTELLRSAIKKFKPTYVVHAA